MVACKRGILTKLKRSNVLMLQINDRELSLQETHDLITKLNCVLRKEGCTNVCFTKENGKYSNVCSKYCIKK